MAHRAKQISLFTFITGGIALSVVLLLVFGTLIAVWGRADFSSGLAPEDWSAIRFTVLQALLSAVLSIVLAVPAARALARRRFFGRQALVSLLGAPFLLPGIVAVLGILAVWGRSGYISDLLGWGGFEPLNIYGITGVVLAHVFFNLPLATRLILQGWLSIPSEHFRLSAQLGFTTRDVSKRLERPMLWSVVPGAFLLVFLLCITSFAVALALGGGPKATTVELAIYQALRFDFDLSKAAFLAVIQFGLCAAVAAITLVVAKPASFSLGLDRPVARWDAKEPLAKAFDTVVLVFLLLFLALPLLSILLKGLPAMLSLPSQVWPAAVRSVSVSVVSAILTLALTLALSTFILRVAPRAKRASQTIEGISFLTLAASPFVIGTGLFIIINPYFDPFALALPVTTTVNAAMSLPFALRVILPAQLRAEQHYGRLADSLDMKGLARFRLAIWPRLRRPAGFATGLSAALSMGDLGVIALFAPPDTATLPLTMYRLMASYQMEAASGVALLLITLSLALFWCFDRGGRLEHHIR